MGVPSSFGHRYTIEPSQPESSRCACCGGLTVHLTRLVRRDGDAFAVYRASYSTNHADDEIALLLCLGEWGDGTDAGDRVAFYCRIRPIDGSHGVMLGDASESGWDDVERLGVGLTRAAALAHPWKSTAFEVVDMACAEDASIRGFLHRVRCGDAAVPLEWSFGAPDDVFALGDAAEKRVVRDDGVLLLDGTRLFVRCLLPIAIEGYGDWRIGVWIEIGARERERLRAALSDPASYVGLSFSGRLANDVGPDLALPLAPGAELLLAVRAKDEPPHVVGPMTGELEKLLFDGWSREAFEAYAVPRGFL